MMRSKNNSFDRSKTANIHVVKPSATKTLCDGCQKLEVNNELCHN